MALVEGENLDTDVHETRMLCEHRGRDKSEVSARHGMLTVACKALGAGRGWDRLSPMASEGTALLTP